MSHFPSICCSPPLNCQLLFYYVHGGHFDYRALNILWSLHIQSFILNVGDYVHIHPNYNGTTFKLNNLYCNARINWERKHRTLKVTPSHINSIFVETWGDFKLTSPTISQESFNNTSLIPLSLSDKGTDHHACLAYNHTSNGQKADEI